MHDNHKFKHGKWACCWVSVPGERSSHALTAHESAREQTHQWWKWWQTRSMGKAASHNICLCFVYKLLYQFLKYLRTLQRCHLVLQTPFFCGYDGSSLNVTHLRDKNPGGLGWRFFHDLLWLLLLLPFPTAMISVVCGDVALSSVKVPFCECWCAFSLHNSVMR